MHMIVYPIYHCDQMHACTIPDCIHNCIRACMYVLSVYGKSHVHACIYMCYICVHACIMYMYSWWNDIKSVFMTICMHGYADIMTIVLVTTKFALVILNFNYPRLQPHNCRSVAQYRYGFGSRQHPSQAPWDDHALSTPRLSYTITT